MRFILLLTALFALFSFARAADWVVIVAGSNTYSNYRHQADACHAYQISKGWGVPESQIITMMYDDIASSPYNPFPGQVFNKPTAKGTAGVDVYKGCKIDYSGNDVTAENFLAVLQGDATAVPAGKPVLKTTAADRIFVYYTDHGAVGIVAMPVGNYLYAEDLNKALSAMYAAKKYSKLVFYMEACESGSMFEGLLDANIEVYVTTASNAIESSWGTYCAPDDMVNGVEVGSCLGDLYSVVWMENSDAAGEYETIDTQTDVVVKGTTMSHVMEYGTQEFVSLPIGDFQGNLDVDPATAAARFGGKTMKPSAAANSTTVDSRDIALHTMYTRYMRAVKANQPTELAAAALADLQAELARREFSDNFFNALALAVKPDGSLFGAVSLPVGATACQKAVDRAIGACGVWNDYSLKYHRVVVNACMQGGDNAQTTLINAVNDVCAKVSKPASLTF